MKYYFKSLFVIIAVILLPLKAVSQDTVFYKGELVIRETQKLILTLQIITDKDTTKIAMGSPYQTEKLFPATKSKITKDSVKFNIADMGVRLRLKYFEGKQTLKGSFRQGFLNKEVTFQQT